MKTLTVFTPTYNRAYILPQLYESLKNQRCKDFAWLIVDDGSSDTTKEIVEGWISESLVDITYVYQENGGKMRAHNKGVSMCTTPLFFCVDSDDSVYPNTIERIVQEYQTLVHHADYEHLIGMIAKRYMKGRHNYDAPQRETITLAGLYEAGYKGETAIVFRTDVIRKFPFPEIMGEKFVPENYSYRLIDQKYNYLLYNESWVICEYQADGYCMNWTKNYHENPKGWALYYSQTYDLCAKTIKEKVKTMSMYVCFCLIAKRSLLKTICKSSSMPVCLLSIPFGYRYYKQHLDSYKNYLKNKELQ